VRLCLTFSLVIVGTWVLLMTLKMAPQFYSSVPVSHDGTSAHHQKPEPEAAKCQPLLLVIGYFPTMTRETGRCLPGVSSVANYRSDRSPFSTSLLTLESFHSVTDLNVVALSNELTALLHFISCVHTALRGLQLFWKRCFIYFCAVPFVIDPHC